MIDIGIAISKILCHRGHSSAISGLGLKESGCRNKSGMTVILESIFEMTII
jgi:hypothetical protein